MLRRFCGNGWGAFSTAELTAVEQLASSHQQLLLDGGFADVRSEAGYTACAMLLTNIDNVARTMSLEVAPRAYRTAFSANYRALFPDGSRHYRVDVLEASVDQHSAIWVNGDKFELSAEAIGHAEALQQSWADLGLLLDRWIVSRNLESHSAKPSRAEVATALVSLDMVWAHFECKYISELIAIEEQARQLIVKAVNFESRLTKLNGADFQEIERELVQCIAHLNSVANFKRKGRDDLGRDILDGARHVMLRCEPGRHDSFRGEAKGAAQVLASDVLASYDAMRAYLSEVGSCIERVDPHLCNNSGLVARLVDWEESWEVGARYVRDSCLLDAVCDLVAEVKAAQAVVPALTAMCEDCDVELFLVLPRVVLLCFVADPESQRADLVRNLLPHRFVTAERLGLPAGTVPTMMASELKALHKQFLEAMQALERTHPVSATHMTERDELEVTRTLAAWEVLVKRAVLGSGEDSCANYPPPTQKLIEDLMREVERWSLELQRHCPEDWNQFSAVLVQCLTGGEPKQATGKFLV